MTVVEVPLPSREAKYILDNLWDEAVEIKKTETDLEQVVIVEAEYLEKALRQLQGSAKT